MNAEAIAIIGSAVGILAVLVPLMVTLHGRTDRRIDALAANVAEVRRDLHALAERVARIEGALTGPWRPANGAPAPAPGTPSEAVP